MQVNFYEKVNDELLKFAVIISKSDGKWVFCKHKEWTYPLIQPRLIEEYQRRAEKK